VYYKELGRGLIKNNQFVPSFRHLIWNFEAVTKCGACACFEKATPYGLCQLCHFYARHGMNEQVNATSDEMLNFLVKKVYKINSLKESQRTAINTYMSGQHTFVIMPTGTGKSLCYWASAALHSGLTVVLEPLIALMQDQMVRIELVNWLPYLKY
jgi:superfamily II DNA helicase RecQ